MFIKYNFILIILICVFSGSTAISQSVDVDKKIEEFILKNPEIIIKSLQNFEKNKEKEKEQTIKIFLDKNINTLQNGDGKLFSGRKKSKNIIIEFFDYNCGYCKKSHEEIKKILLEENDIKIIYLNLPVIADNSVELAKISLAIGIEDKMKFNKFHDFLLDTKRSPKDDDIRSFIEKLGLDYKKIKNASESEEIKEIINKNILMANNLQIGGTPAFIINGELVSGFVSKKIMISLLKKGS